MNRYNDLGEPRYEKSNLNTKDKHYPSWQRYLKMLDCDPHPLPSTQCRNHNNKLKTRLEMSMR